MTAQYHSTFTPSKSDRETLERLLVAREELARGILDGIVESASTGTKHQRLLIGPRGIGKTHLVSLIYYRVCDNPELHERLRIAWLREDLYVASYSGLLLEILRKLAEEYQLDDLRRQLEEVLNVRGASKKEAILERLLLDVLGERTLLLITENLDDLLLDLKEAGQHKLRALLQNHPKVTILATATSLVDAVTERKKVFYGFFRVSILRPLSVEQAVELLARLADRAHDADLAAALRSPMGLARVRAVHYLAGGNPRIYVLFYDFLNRESLDDLARPFMKLVDELTPYYQARMSRLAPLQRRILDVLRQLRGASTVTEIARQAMSSPQSISSQLSKLKDLGYVIQADSLGRSNYYELREPLMRLVLEVKEQQGRTVELFVQFLRVWYSETELDQLASVPAADLETSHLSTAAQRARSEPDPLLVSLSSEFSRHQLAGNHEAALQEAEIAIHRAPRLKEGWVRKARCLTALGRSLEERLVCWQRVAELDPQDMLAWNSQDVILSELGRYEEALAASRRAVELQPEDPILNRNYGSVLKQLGQATEARTYFEKALSLRGEPKTAADWDLRGQDLWVMNRLEEALDAFAKALELDPRGISAWGHLWGGLDEQGRLRLFHRMAVRLAELLPAEALLQSYLGTAHANLGRYEDALAAYEHALQLDPQLDFKREPTSLHRAIILSYLSRDREALAALELCAPGDAKLLRFRIDMVHAHVQMWLGHWEEGRAELERILERDSPPLWSGKNLRLGVPLARSANPEIWRPFITTWLAVFGRHQRLAELGQGLVHSLRTLILPWVSDDAALAWQKTWQELAGDVPELALPLRLLAAGVDYRIHRDPRTLLGLAREERGLLEPWLVNLFATESTESDQGLEALLHQVEQRLTAEAADERARAFWQSPAPDPASLDFQRLLRRYGEPATVQLARLLPGSWQRLSPAETEDLLRRAAADNALAALAWSRPELQVLTVDRLPLQCSAGSLIQVHLRAGDRDGALDLLATEGQVVVLDGFSRTLYDLVEQGVIRLETEEAQSEFTRFFCNVVRGEEGRFQIVSAPADLRLAPGTELPAEMHIQPWQPIERPANDDRPRFAGTVLYARALFQAKLQLQPEPRGFVEMLDDEPLAQNLACSSESFDGPIRFYQPPPERAALTPDTAE